MSVSDILKIFCLPELASEHGELVDQMHGFVTWFMTFLFVGWSTFLIYVFTVFRASKGAKANYHGVRGHASTHIEIGVCIVEAILLLGFAFPLWARQSEEYPTGPDTVRMRAIGEKFKWTFHYAGNDGVLGRVDPRLISQDNPIGRDLLDPNGKDDFLTGSLQLPVGRPVIIDVRSKDVIHNLCLVPMRAAQDATPGVPAHLWFKPVKTGSWDIICGQLCGPGHAGMKAQLEVIKSTDFDSWMKSNSDDAIKAAAPAAPSVPATH
jgi:cytochrome c oxidase subunit II